MSAESPNPSRVVVDIETGEEGGYADWVARFAEFWEAPRERLDRLPRILGPNIRLKAPGLKPTVGVEAGMEAFRKTFQALPDLTSTVENWSGSGDVLFIEVVFTATIGGRATHWRNIDRFTFDKGVAVERVAHFSPMPLYLAALKSPRGIGQLLKLPR